MHLPRLYKLQSQPSTCLVALKHSRKPHMPSAVGPTIPLCYSIATKTALSQHHPLTSPSQSTSMTVQYMYASLESTSAQTNSMTTASTSCFTRHSPGTLCRVTANKTSWLARYSSHTTISTPIHSRLSRPQTTMMDKPFSLCPSILSLVSRLLLVVPCSTIGTPRTTLLLGLTSIVLPLTAPILSVASTC